MLPRLCRPTVRDRGASPPKVPEGGSVSKRDARCVGQPAHLPKTPPEKKIPLLTRLIFTSDFDYGQWLITGLAETNGRGSEPGWQVKQPDLCQLQRVERQTWSHRQGLVGCAEVVVLQTCQSVGQKCTFGAG